MAAPAVPNDSDLAARLDAIAHASYDAIIGKTVDGIITAWNPAAERIFGYTSAEALGQSILLITPEDRVDEETGVLERLQRSETVGPFESVCRAKDGRRLTMLLTMWPVKNREGRVTGGISIARDISERQRVLDALRRSETQASAILEAASEGIVVVNAAGTIIRSE